MSRRAVLVVEDGTEYRDAFVRLGGGDASLELLAAGDAAAALGILAARPVDAVFLDLVFDRTPPERLVGETAALAARFDGDRERLLDHLARNQGYYVLAALAPHLPAGVLVLLAHDFAAEPERLAALRASVPRLDGVGEAETATRILDRLRRG
ncbi:MAG TPA: hypothetical protein VMN82_15705 [Thermoanaerobaculia bacterium]|nr:hypothetical protein [Thermoanaerobaculia bacterium]